MSFNEESAMPEIPGGNNETALKTEHRTDDAQPSVQSTDRFGLEKAGKGWLLRRYDIEISKIGNPYFKPIESLLQTFVADADDAFAEARARYNADEDLQAKAAALMPAAVAYFDALLEYAGEDREWLARSLEIWPLTNQVGYHLYKATSGEADLVDYAQYLLATDANVNCVGDLDTHEKYAKRQFFTDSAYDELGVIDAIVQEIEATDYNTAAIIRSGYQADAGKDTREHLKGNKGHAPVTETSDSAKVKADILASRRVASQAA